MNFRRCAQIFLGTTAYLVASTAPNSGQNLVRIAAAGGTASSHSSNSLLIRAMATSSTGIESIAPPRQLCVGYITIKEADAQALATKLVQSALVACVNILPGVKSVYQWEGKLETDSEVLLILKTRAEHQTALVDFVRKNHPYDVPEVIFTPITAGNPAYMDWVVSSTEPAATGT